MPIKKTKKKKIRISKEIQNYLMSKNKHHYMRNGKKAVGYVRNSKKIRSTEFNLQDQEAFISQKAKEKKLKLIKIYNEGVKSGAKDKRPVFFQMLEDVKKDLSITTIIVSSLDRLSREGDEIALTLHQLGVNLISAREKTDILTSDSLAVTRRLLLDAKVEHIKKSASITLFRSRMLKDGIKSAIPPFGYKHSASNHKKRGRIIIDPLLARKIRSSFELFAKGLKVDEIMKKLRYTKNDIKRRQFWNMIKDPFYIGIIQDKSSPELIIGSHTPLISVSLYRKCLSKLGIL
jgi:DNA invertase Pin-like site-specific DNA recombinase